jgi:hypothetical protein
MRKGSTLFRSLDNYPELPSWMDSETWYRKFLERWEGTVAAGNPNFLKAFYWCFWKQMMLICLLFVYNQLAQFGLSVLLIFFV